MRRHGDKLAKLDCTVPSTAGGTQSRPTTRALPASYHSRTPSVAAKLRLVARFAALAVLANVRIGLRQFVSFASHWWAE